MSTAQKEYIRQLITEAGSIGEIDGIESQLRDGTFVFPEHLQSAGEVEGAGSDDAMGGNDGDLGKMEQ